MPTQLLFVDDDANILAAFRRNLRGQFTFDTALGAEEALGLLRRGGPYAVIIADMNMPGMDGIELLEHARLLSPDTVPLMLTGNADQQTAVDSVNRARVFRFLNKPCPPEVLVPALHSAIQQYEQRRIERELLEGTLMSCVKLLTDVLGTVAPDALGRGQRLRLAIGQYARTRGIAAAWECEVAALLSAIGFAAVPPSIVQKIGEGVPLTLTEETIVRRVPQIGHDLVADIPRFAGVAAAILYQKKYFDGTGFPADACKEAAIPIGARLLRIFADRLELEADGVVKQAAFETMAARTGVYDEALLADCFEVFPSFLPNALAGDRPVGSVSVSQLQPGLVAVAEICTRNGLVIVGAGHVLTETVIERINNFALLGEVKEPILVQEPAKDNAEAPVPELAASS